MAGPYADARPVRSVGPDHPSISAVLPTRRLPLGGDLPNVAARLTEAGGPRSPWAVHRAVQQLHPTLKQLGTERVHIVHFESELHA